MSRYAWLTDPHFVFLRDPKTGEFDPEFFTFLDELRASRLDGLLISGDISEAPELVRHLELLDDKLELPIWFILGNHDFYKGSLAEVREKVRQLCKTRTRLIYLSDSPPIELAPSVGLVGHDAFADGRYGLFHWSDFKISDELYIADLVGLKDDERLALRMKLADEAAAHLGRVLPAALAQFQRVVVITHYPPFPESARYKGKTCDDYALPYFACKAVGDILLTVADSHPQREITVLCGHTHERYELKPRPNLTVLTGAAEYGIPAVERILEF